MNEKTENQTKHYYVSGLDYTLPKMLTAMALILIGYFAYIFSVGAVPLIVPIKLKELGVSSTLMIFIMTTLGQILNMTVCPWVSFKSDRYRSKRWGRRVPFILFTLPMLCLSWIIIGCYQEETNLLRNFLNFLSPTTLAVVILAFGVVMFKFFFMFVGSVIYYIYYDVIPPQFLTRFNGALQITASLATAIFNLFVFKHTEGYFREIFIGITVLYAVLMSIMCFFLKEPRFPEPEKEEKKGRRGIGELILFFKESFCHRIYIYGCLQSTFSSAALATSIFLVFFMQSMGLSLADIGKLNGMSGISSTVFTIIIAIACTVFVDRWHPVRIMVFLIPFTILTQFYESRWFFFDVSGSVFFWASFLGGIASFLHAITGVASMPFLMRTLPKSRFGSFCSARSLVISIIGLGLTLLLGVYIDFLKIDLALGEKAYRGIYFWQLFFHLLGVIFYLLFYREYQKLGGYSAYQAPAPWEKEGFEKMDVSETVPPKVRHLQKVMYGFDALFILSVLSSAGFGMYTYNIGATAEAQRFLYIALPISILAALLYGTVRFQIRQRCKSILSGKPASIPHHGILLLALLMRLGYFAAFQVESFLAISTGGNGAAGGLRAYENAIDIVLAAMLYLCMKFETKVSEE